jgi:Iron-containing redox enzyme
MTTVLAVPAGERLRTKLQIVVPGMRARLQCLWEHPEPRATYVTWLRMLHGTIRATVPLMLDAVAECLRRPDDPVADPLGAYFAKHIREEYGHDRWVAEDYGAAGGDPGELATMRPAAAVAALVGSQYYWIRHSHPVALLGHIAVLEGDPPATTAAAELSRRTGLPVEAFRALSRHAVLDIKHRDEMFRVLNELPLRPWHEALITASALHTVAGVCEVVDETLARVDRGSVP